MRGSTVRSSGEHGLPSTRETMANSEYRFRAAGSGWLKAKVDSLLSISGLTTGSRATAMAWYSMTSKSVPLVEAGHGHPAWTACGRGVLGN